MNTNEAFSLTGKTILVTGASSGIGRGIAISSSQMGASVICCGRNIDRLKETLKLLTGESHYLWRCDFADIESLKERISELPKLDGVVHCAGVGQRILGKSITPSDIDQVMTVNFKTPVLLQSGLLSEKKINKGGSIVFIASIASESPSIGNSIYSASKGAIISFAKCLSLELAPRKIRVNCISPAMVWTDLIFNGGVSLEQLQEDEKEYPLKRYGQPEDIAYLTTYLLSDASSWMTGSNLKITGGGTL